MSISYSIMVLCTYVLQTSILTFLLVTAAFANAAYLFSRKRKYHFHRRSDPIASPNAKFVPKDWDEVRAPSKPLWRRTLAFSWWAFISSWRFLLNIPPPPASAGTNGNPKARVQELDVWFPGELELQLFSIYSPVHALLWLATASSNWIIMVFSMGLLTILVRSSLLLHMPLTDCHAAQLFDLHLPDADQGQGDHRRGGYERIQRRGEYKGHFPCPSV